MQQTQSTQSGNALFLILIAVALFAALSFAVTYSNRSSSPGDTSSENALIASSEMVQYGATLESAITAMRVNNLCSPDNISFERAPFDGSHTDYVNPSAPSDFSCHIFHPNGGRTTLMPPPKGSNDESDWAYVEATVLGMGANQTACGANCNDILLILGGVKQNVCAKVNERLLGSSTIPVQDDGANYENQKYVGTFGGAANIDGGSASVSAMCTEDTDGTYYYYRVLLER